MLAAPSGILIVDMRSLARSRSHFKKALGRLPLGVASNFRYWGEEQTIYVKRGEGCRLWDLDGNAYIDYRLGYGPAILGYAHPRVDEAARQGMEVGGVFALGTEMEYEVADRICRMVPSAELVRFSNSGTEAVMAALRVARAFTGRDDYVVVEGGYHGLFNDVLWCAEVEDWQPADGDPPIIAYSEGVPESVKRHFHTVPMNDANGVEDLFRRHGDRIGAFLIEPIMGNCCGITATAEYLAAVRELCDRYGTVLIVDEVKTGFRVARGGVQELFDLRADLCTLAKAMSNGYPISAVAGREDIMRKFGDGVAHGGTFTAHSVSIAAAAETLTILEDTTTLADIEANGETLRAGLSRILDERSVAHCFAGHPALSGLFFRDTPPVDYRDWLNADYQLYDALAPELHEQGVLVEPDSREPWFLSSAHDVEPIGETLYKFERALDITLARHGHRNTQDAGA